MTPATGTVTEPTIVWLDDATASDRWLTGAKAANLADSRRRGLPVLDGFVLTTLGTSQLNDRERLLSSGVDNPVIQAWDRISRSGTRALAVRSSSVVEDSTTSSMAGRFVSVLHVAGWEAFVDAVFEVVASAATTEIADAPMAVLVQPMAAARLGGVMFGLDPLTGDRRSLRISVVEGLPDQIVSGTATGTQIVTTRRGRLRSVAGPLPATLGARHRRRLARLAAVAARVFGGPQDIEWLIDLDGELRLLQSRPITASALPAEHSHPLGPGPVAETFPNPLHPLERDLWEPPLEDGIREALRLSGAVSRRALANRFVVDVGGRVAVDLEALGVVKPRRSFLWRLDPRPPSRHLVAAWRIGRLRAALPLIAHDLIGEVDDDLAAVPAPAELGDHQLLTVLDNAQITLRALHSYEVLSGFFLEQRRTATSGAAVALSTLERARREGLTSDADIIARYPVVLALLPPEIGGSRILPAVDGAPPMPSGDAEDRTAIAREALRLRVRWVQELTVAVAEELGNRLAARGQLRRALDVREMDLATLRAVVADLDAAGVLRPAPVGVAPLPARFRLAADGSIVPDVASAGSGPLGVSAGRVQATVTHDPADAAGKVLVVPTFDPSLAGVIGRAAAVVSETGSPLSHLAILAREYRVPAVVDAGDAVGRLAEGSVVLVDGSAGTVEIIEEAAGADEPPGDADAAVGVDVEDGDWSTRAHSEMACLSGWRQES